MKTKMELAHDWMMKHDDGSMSVEVVVFKAWQYADAMQAEADKREKEEAAQKRKEIRDMLSAPNTFVEREGQHFDDVEIMEINEHHTIHLPSIKKFGAWVYKNGQREFFVGNKDEVEAARGGNE